MNQLKTAAFPRRALTIGLAICLANTVAPANAQYSSLINMGTSLLRHAARNASRSSHYSSSQNPDAGQSAPTTQNPPATQITPVGQGVDPDTGAYNSSPDNSGTNNTNEDAQDGNGNGNVYVKGNSNVYINGRPYTGAHQIPANGGFSAGSSPTGRYQNNAGPGTNLQSGVYQPNPYVPNSSQQPVSYTPNTFAPAMPPGYTSAGGPPPGYGGSGGPPPTVYRGRHADRHSISRINDTIRTHNRAVDIYNKAVDQLKQEQYTDAIASCNAALQIDPAVGSAHHLLGIAYNDTQQYDRAIDECRLAIEQDSSNADNYYTAGDAARHLRDFKSEYNYYKRFLALGGSGDRADEARSVLAILDHNYFHQADGDYLADATKEGVQRWPLPAMPIKVFIDDKTQVEGYRPAYLPALQEAFKDWEQSSQGKISFIIVDQAEKANITCAWTSERTKLGSLEELGLTKRTATTEGEILSAHIDFYSLADKKGTEEELVRMAKAVDLHEIGHALGLNHSQQPYDIMYYCTAPDGLEFPLSPRDKATMIALYNGASANVATSPSPLDGDANAITASSLKLQGRK